MDKQEHKLKVKSHTFQLLMVITYAFALYKLNFISESLKNLSQMLTPFYIGFTIAYLVNIIIVKIEKIMNAKTIQNEKLTERGYKLLVVLIYIITLCAVAGLLILIIPSTIASIENVVTSLMNIDVVKLNDSISEFILDITGKTYVLNDLIVYITESMTTLLNSFKDILPYIMGITKQAFGVFLNFLLGIIVSIYMLLNKKNYLKGIKKISRAYLGEEKTHFISSVANKVNTAFSDFISTVLIGAVIVSTITFIVTNLMRISNPPLIAIVIAIGNLIPFFGPILGLIIAVILVFISTPDKVLFYMIFAILLQQFDANILNPKIVGDKLGLDALLVIFAVIIMSGLFGFLGTLVGVPIFAVIYYLIKESVNKKLDNPSILNTPK